MTSCCPHRQEVTALLKGRLSSTVAEELERHLESCRECQLALDSAPEVQSLSVTLRSAPPASKELSAEVVQVLRVLPSLSSPTFGPADVTPQPERLLPTLQPGQPGELGRLDRYAIHDILGTGGMGIVYRAMDSRLCRPVALKVLLPRYAQHLSAQQRFLAEARALAGLHHDNVVTVHEVGESEVFGRTVPFFAMELLQGECLSHRLRRERLSIADALQIARQAADGLSAAHAVKLVHRDVKPANLWLEQLGEGWRVKLLDFGLATPEQGGVGSVAGTPAYMAPEQLSGQPLDARTDIYGLGCVLYEMLTGRPAFQDAVRPRIPMPAERNRGVGDRLNALVRRMLAADPAQRPQSAREVSLELAAIEHSRKRSFSKIGLVVAGFAACFFAVTRMIASQQPPVYMPPPTEQVAQLSVEQWAAADATPLDDLWVSRVQTLDTESQRKVVLAKLQQLNPQFDGQLEAVTISGEQIVLIKFCTDNISNIRPLRALRKLQNLSACGSKPGCGQLADLSPLRGLPIRTIDIWQNPCLADLEPLRGMPLVHLQAGDTAIASLEPLRGAPLRLVAVNNCLVQDISVAASWTMLEHLRIDDNPIANIQGLSKLRSLYRLTLTYQPARDHQIIQGLSSLALINSIPAADFRRKHNVTK